MIRKAQAISSLCPTAEWALIGDQEEQLQWLSPNISQPTEAEIQAEVARLQAEYDNNEYQRQRASAYPSIADQLDKIYHEGIDAWKADIAAVKNQYPKGGA